MSNVAVSIPDDDFAQRWTNKLTSADKIGDEDLSSIVEGIDSVNDASYSGSAQRRKLTKEEKKRRQGSNKGRRFGKMREELELCWRVAIGESCEFGEESV